MKPIILTAPEVLRARAGTMQLRRPIKPQPIVHSAPFQPDTFEWHCQGVTEAGYCHTDRFSFERLAVKVCPFGGIGERLWVKEAWRFSALDYAAGMATVHYRADDARRSLACNVWPQVIALDQRWNLATHLRRWASRLTLELTQVRAERGESGWEWVVDVKEVQEGK